MMIDRHSNDQAKSQAGPPGSSLRALIVDDTPDDAELIVAALEAAGSRVHFECVDSPEGLAGALERGPWDIVLCDHTMPRFSSELALLQLASAGSKVPAIVVSGTIGEEATVAAMRAGAVDFISKDRLVRLPAAVRRARDEAAHARERERLEEELTQARRSEAIALLAAGVAHELSNLLAVILGFSDLVSDELGVGHPLQTHVGEIHVAAEHSAALTKDLRAFAGHQELERKPITAAQIADGVRRMLASTVGGLIEIVVEDESNGAQVLGDAAQLGQALLYLALNARDAMPDGGVLTVRTTLEPGSTMSGSKARTVKISVSDTGTGISDDVRSRIFEPFFTTKKPGQRTGLGLSVVLGTVKQTGGTVIVESEPGRGSTFTIALPELEPPLPGD
jgi:signal transduction histidine kinase